MPVKGQVLYPLTWLKRPDTGSQSTTGTDCNTRNFVVVPLPITAPGAPALIPKPSGSSKT